MTIVFNNQRWQRVIENLVQILRINVCIVDLTGKSIAIPSQNPYGWKLLTDTSQISLNFSESGEYLEFVDGLKLNHCAIPLQNFQNDTKGYLVLGPLILNKKLDKTQYQKLARQLNYNFDGINDSLENIRVISHTQLQSIIELLKGITELNQGALQIALDKGLQKVLQSFLELSLGITHGHSGSIMLFNAQTQELSIQAASGLDKKYVQRPVKLNEGLAGLAFQDKKAMILTDKSSDDRISRFLTRTEIEQSIVMPFETSSKQIQGVLNLNISNDPANSVDVMTQHLSRLTSLILQIL